MFRTQKTSSSKNSSWLFDTYLCVECCKSQGNFQYFKAAFMMTPWVHTITSPRTPHLHTGPTLNTLRYKLCYKASSVKCLYWILRAKVSPTRSLCLPFQKATVLSCTGRSKSILNCGALFQSSENGCMSIFKGGQVLLITAASVSTRQGSERNTFKA